MPGILRLCAHGARHDDAAAIARDLGAPVDTDGTAPDVTIRFVQELSPAGLRLLDGGTMGYADDGVYFMDSSHRPMARVSLGERWGEAVIVCRHGTGRIPFLSAAVDFAALSRGWAPVHGSAWVTRQGIGVLVCGWAHSGKTGALLSACESGATPVGDDRILLSRDGGSMVGLGRAIVVKDWHLAQLRMPALGPRRSRRLLARAAFSLEAHLKRTASHRRGGAWARVASQALRRLRDASSVELDPSRLVEGASELHGRARPDILIILETHRRSSVDPEPTDPDTVANRVAAQVEADLAPILRAHLCFKYAFPQRGWRNVSRAPEVAEDILLEATRGMPSYVVRHPYPCSLTDLDQVIDALVASSS